MYITYPNERTYLNMYIVNIYIYIYISVRYKNPMLPTCFFFGSINKGFGKGSFFRLGVDPTYPNGS